MTSTVSYAALYYVQPDIFDGLQLPTQLNAADVKQLILLDTMELEALYPDPDVIKEAVGIWSRNRVHSWQKIADALYKNYDPFVNFTRDESRTITENRDLYGSATNSGKDTSENSGKAYDSGTYTGRTKDELTHGKKVNTTDTGRVTTEEYYHSQGDSAMYTPTDIAAKETKLRIDNDIISIIVREFIERFCLMVY